MRYELAAILLLAAPAARATVQASVASPSAGAHVTGDAVTVAASLSSADLRLTRRVLFQYRAVGGGAWIDMAGSTARPNPDTRAPFYAHWDTTALAPGNYELRAVAADAGGDDPSPAPVAVTVDPVAFTVLEHKVGGLVQREQTVTRAGTSVVDDGDAPRLQFARLMMPPNALDNAAATLTMESNPAGLGPAPMGYALVGSVRMTLSDGQACFCSGTSATLILSYVDADGDGIVDGTVARPQGLKVMHYDVASASWRVEAPTLVDSGARTVTTTVRNLGGYAVMAPTTPTGPVVRIYPVPFKPNGGDPDEGRPYVPGDLDSGIVFENLLESSSIVVYTDAGSRVASLTVGSARRFQWDAKNEQGQDVASGLYIAVIKLPDGRSETHKLLIAR